MSREIDNLRITKLREYLMNVITEIKENFEQLNVDFLSNEPDNYSLDKIPVVPQVEQWIIGNTVYRDTFNFRSRMNYSAEVISNIKNIGFFEAFETLIKEKNDRNELPNIDGIESIKCLNVGTMVSAETKTAEFSIQIQIEYIDVGKKVFPSL